MHTRSGRAGLTPAEFTELERFLVKQWRGVWTAPDFRRHINAYADMDLADADVEHVLAQAPNARDVLDIGSGFGSFVISARARGLRAFGLDIGEFESAFSARRMARLGLPGAVTRGDAHALPYASNSFDVVTMWNVLEHVWSADRVLSHVARVLRPGGSLILVCPNYLAPRPEAHYHVPWLPLMPRGLARIYLRLLGKSPDFLDCSIHYQTNIGVMRALGRAGLRPMDPRRTKFANPELISAPRLRHAVQAVRRSPLGGLLYAFLWVSFWNPFRPSVTVLAKKPLAREDVSHRAD